MDALEIVAEPNRRKILHLVWSEEMAAGAIAENFDLTFGAVSQQLKILREAGLVDMRKDGNRRMYRINDQGIEPFRGVLESMWASALDDLASAVEGDEG